MPLYWDHFNLASYKVPPTYMQSENGQSKFPDNLVLWKPHLNLHNAILPIQNQVI